MCIYPVGAKYSIYKTWHYFKTEKRICSLIKFKTDSIIIQAIDGISKLIGWWLTKLRSDRCLPGFCNTMHKFTTKKHVLKWTWFVPLHILYANGTRHISISLGNFCVKWVGIWWNRNINTTKTHRKIKRAIIQVEK